MSYLRRAIPSGDRNWLSGFYGLIAIIGMLLIDIDRAQAQDGAVAGHSLSPQQQSMASISSLTAIGDLEGLSSALDDGLEAGLTINEIKEVLVHLYAYSGFPRSLQGLNTFMDVLEARRGRGIEDEIGRSASPTMGHGDRYAQGEAVLSEIAGWPTTAPLSGYAAFSPVIEQFLKEHLFADIFGRDVLTYVDREIVTIAALASMGGVEPMLNSHLGVGMNVGLSDAQLQEIIAITESNVAEDQTASSRRVLSEFLATDSTKERRAASRRGADEVGESAKEERRLSSIDTIFPRGARTENDNFSGPVSVQMLVTESDVFDTRVGNVTFEPGSRTNWHSHPGGQILLATAGIGYYQERGGPIQLLRKGDVVKISPNVEHWHGATPDSEFTHVAIVTNDGKGGTVWLEPVSDREYHQFQ